MIKPLTSLRFFFAFIVFACHCDYMANYSESLHELYFKILYDGYLGVSFFFILSGFILALNYKEKVLYKKITSRDFLVQRIARIYPMHLFTLFLAVPLYFGHYSADLLGWILKFITNALLLQSYCPSNKVFFAYNGVSWSISDELFFYASFPFLIIAFYKRSYWKLLACLGILAIPVLIFLFPHVNQHWVFYINPFARIFEFIIGILLYEVYQKKYLSKYFQSRFSASVMEISSVLLFLVFFAFHNSFSEGYRYSCYYWIPMVAVIFAFAFNKGVLSTVLSASFLVFLGEISYSFYLVHQIVIRYGNYLNDHFIFYRNAWVLFFLYLALTIIASAITYFYVELPGRDFIKRKFLTPRPNKTG